MIRIKLIHILYGEDVCKLLLDNTNIDCLNIVGSFLCKACTLDNETRNSIVEQNGKTFTFLSFRDTICKLLDQFEYIPDKVSKMKQCEFLYRYINIFYATIASTKTNNFTQIIYNKIFLLQMECNSVCDEINKQIRHKYHTRGNNDRRQLYNLSIISRNRFVKESNETISLLNSIKQNHSIWM